MALLRRRFAITMMGRLADGAVTVDNNPGGYECPTHMFYW